MEKNPQNLPGFSRIISFFLPEDTALGGAFVRRKHCVSADLRMNHRKCHENFLCQKTAASRRGRILFGVAFLQIFNPSRVGPWSWLAPSFRDARPLSGSLEV